MVLGVVNLGERHVDGEFPVAPSSQMPPLGSGHGGMSRDSPVNQDRARPGFGAHTGTSFYVGVIGRIFDVGGYNESFCSPIGLIGLILGVPDIDAVVEGMVGDVVDETRWWDQTLVFFVGLLWVIIVDLRVFVVVVNRHRQRAATQLGGECSFRGVFRNGRLRGGLSTVAGVAINKSTTPHDVVVLEGKTTDPAMVSADVLVVGRDFKFW